MIRRGTKEGWLKLPISSLQPWAQFNGVVFNGIKCDEIPGSGSGVVADRDLKGGDEGPLMVIPRELILSLEQIKLYALSDQNLNEVLVALGDFARVSSHFYFNLSYWFKSNHNTMPTFTISFHPRPLTVIFDLRLLL
jgi:hypothetical protein